jgi:hypothetical protein
MTAHAPHDEAADYIGLALLADIAALPEDRRGAMFHEAASQLDADYAKLDAAMQARVRDVVLWALSNGFVRWQPQEESR